MISPSRTLFLLDRERQARRQQVGQPPRLARVDRRDLELFGNLLALVDHSLKKPIHVVDQGVELDSGLDDLIARLDPADQVGLGLRDRDQAGPVLPLADDPGRAVRELEHLEDQAHADHREKVVHPGRVGLGMELADQADHALADHAVIDQADAAGTVDHERNHGLRKDHVGSQGQERDVTWLQGLIGVPLGQHDELP